MGAITGSNTNIIFKKGTTHGTAVSGGAGDKLVLGSEGSLSQSQEVDVLNHGGIGSGLSAYTDGTKGGVRPSLSISNLTVGYNNNFGTLLRTFFGSASVGAEITPTKGDYKHTFAYDPIVNRFATCAFDAYSAGVFEYPSCYATSLTISTGEPNGYLKASMNLLADERVISGAVNTNISLAAATVSDSEMVVHNQADEFLINAQSGGALASPGNRVNITDLTLSLNDPKEVVAEFKGDDSYGEPRRSGLLEGTLTVTFRNLSDLTWFTAQDSETDYKASFTVTGSAVSAGGSNKNFVINLPKLKILQAPDYNLSSTGENPLTVVFQVYEASANPTGMSDTLPYITIINGKSTAY